MDIVILEDNLDRQAAMRTCLADRFPQYPARIFVDSAELIAHLRKHLTETIVISLDHDLDMIAGDDGRLRDPGDGRAVVAELVKHSPVCAVIVATTNSQAGVAMTEALRSANWLVRQVHPYGDLEWIAKEWFPAVRNAIVGSARPRSISQTSVTVDSVESAVSS